MLQEYLLHNYQDQLKIKKKPKHKKWMMFRNPPPKIKECFLNFLTSKEINTLAEVGKPDDQNLFKKGRQALKNCTKQNN